MVYTYHEKVEWLLRYCSQHMSHDLMFDERVADISEFNVDLGIEQYIMSRLEDKCIILLTGDAGDGKTRVLTNLREKLDDTWMITNDFSELTNPEQDALLLKLSNTLDNKSGEKYAIAANSGILLNCIIRSHPELKKKLQSSSCITIDFSKRNLAADTGDEDYFKKIIHEFFAIDSLTECHSCAIKDNCRFVKNIHSICDDEVLSNVKILYDGLFLTGIHITFRDLLSSLAYLATGGVSCDELLQDRNIADPLAYYNNFFDYQLDNAVLSAFASLDIAKRDISEFDYQQYTKLKEVNGNKSDHLRQLKIQKRKLFFESPEKLLNFFPLGSNKYDLLPVGFLSEYKALLNRLKVEQYLDSMDDHDPTLQSIEMGLNKISDPYRTDSQMVLYDSPPLTPKNIQLVYTSDKAIRLVICTPPFFCSNGQLEFNTSINLEDINEFICVVWNVDESEDSISFDQLPSLRIDYNLFKEILFASSNTFRQSNAKLSENAHVLSYTKKIFSTMGNVRDFELLWIDAQNASSDIRVSILKPSRLSKDKEEKFQISK